MPAPRTAQSPEPPSWSEWKAQHQQKPWYRRYLLMVEWLFEHVNDRLHRWAFVEFLEHAGKFTVLIAVVVWMLEADNRAKERHYRAWELINSARGSTRNGGRIDALEDLSKDGVSLAAAPLEEAWLQGVDLQRATLRKANLRVANLREAFLVRADLREAALEGADLRKASLLAAILPSADFREADHGRLIRLIIPEAINIHPRSTNLQGALLEYAKLQGADLRTVEGLTQEQLDSAYGDNTTLLPKHLTRPAHWTSSKSEEPAE